MPELPEVETIRRGLEKYLVGKSIAAIEIRFARIFNGEPKDILDSEIEGVRRFGKGLVIDFANGLSLVAHVKMTGQFIYQSNQQSDGSNQNGLSKSFHPRLSLPEELPHKHTHVIFTLQNSKSYASNEARLDLARQERSSQRTSSPRTISDASMLYFNDIRKFGWIKIVRTEDVHTLSFFKSLGKELPLKDLLGTLSLEEFGEIVSSSGAPIKTLTMDQRKIAGVGNIYANDALFLSKIDPRRKANSLEKDEIALLYRSLIDVLEKGLAHGGASEVNFIQVDGGKGEYQNHFEVYGKAGENCTICGTLIERIVVGGRGTFYCPVCQG
ncbi:MAG: bifunctional DNA-formamidopyrimidine glycosylase/DNA-(apurinic or apyrimidinic site) lyase [Candidatus Levybacteria bacterium]|nr:bifunctional DNA-formamidopyrimidine glycosylase/DNA-(apurinic or apyrimidinic site) lyase [Candidatus Levybacteria bacterium]